MFCKDCGTQIADDSTICTNCGTNLNSSDNPNYQIVKKVDNPSHAAGVASCCFPMVGLILYFLWKDEKPNSAKLICKWMIGSIFAWVLLYALFLIITLIFSVS